MSMFKISSKDWKKIQDYSQYAWDEYSSEIGGYMVVLKDKEGNFVMQDPVILEQEISGGNTVITKEALAEYFMKSEMKYEPQKVWYCWWHSHHTMSAFWSGTDIAAIEQSRIAQGGYAFALVVNLKEEYLFRVSDWTTGIHTDIEIDIEGKDRVIPKSIKNNVDKLCTKPTITTTSKWVSNYNRVGKNSYINNFTNQASLWADERDSDFVDVEAKVDNILIDYLTSDNYNQFVRDVKSHNKKLKSDKNKYRIGEVSKEKLDQVISYALAEDYIYEKDEVFDENNLDNKEVYSWNRSYIK